MIELLSNVCLLKRLLGPSRVFQSTKRFREDRHFSASALVIGNGWEKTTGKKEKITT
jgi:hypothetical protein